MSLQHDSCVVSEFKQHHSTALSVSVSGIRGKDRSVDVVDMDHEGLGDLLVLCAALVGGDQDHQDWGEETDASLDHRSKERPACV